MAKRVPFTLVVSPTAKVELEALEVFERRQVADAIDANLVFEPLLETRKRKNLGELPAGFAYDPPLWQLKVGEIRVFYTVDERALTVQIRSVRRKPPEKTTQEVVR